MSLRYDEMIKMITYYILSNNFYITLIGIGEGNNTGIINTFFDCRRVLLN